MLVLNSVDNLLEHMKDVQNDVIELSNSSLLKMSNYIEKNSLEVDEDISTALQYQDIITQQLNGTIEAIDSMRECMEIFLDNENLSENSMLKLQDSLGNVLKEAKDKKNRFSGKTSQDDGSNDEIEFF